MLIALVALAGCWDMPARGVEMEKGPAYLTDSHGASGVVHAFLELSEVAPEYDRYWKGALNWLISVAKRDKRINIALDYGQTGVVWFLCMAARHLDSDELLEAAAKAGDFVVAQAVPAGGGYKFPRFVAVAGPSSRDVRRGLERSKRPTGGLDRAAQGGIPTVEQILQRFDKNRDETLTAEELPERVRQRIMRADADGDGVVTRQELDTARRALVRSRKSRRRQQ
jgi:hypothetical protein